jgi:hypothetical protein
MNAEGRGASRWGQDCDEELQDQDGNDPTKNTLNRIVTKSDAASGEKAGVGLVVEIGRTSGT